MADLAVGMYIELELSWADHPFTFSRFKIKNLKVLGTVQSLGLSAVTVIPSKSDVEATAVENTSIEPTCQLRKLEDEELKVLWLKKKEQQDIARAKRDKRKEVTRQYQKRTKKIRQMTNDMKSRPANVIHNIDEIVDEMTAIFESDDEIITNLVCLNSGHNDEYHHITNVAMLSLMLGNAMGLSREQLTVLGTGALLHDVGKIEIPGGINLKKTALNPAEQKIVQRHARRGRKLIERIKEMDTEILDIIEKHHEFLDGSGYPDGLKDEQISQLVRIVAITNQYDNLCNPIDINTAKTPKNALATIYGLYKNRLDEGLVKKLITLLGIYPPGTVVLLNDESIALVISTDAQSSLQPVVLVYDSETPKEEAIIISMIDHPDLKIEKALAPADYPEKIHAYLAIKERIGYLMEKAASNE